MKKEWFAEWFDSPYYHLLYRNHDEKEAQTALDHLLAALDLPPGSRILDLACGRGRHSRYLASKGFAVTGLDISPSSIAFARQYEHEHLEFYRHDMRKPFITRPFDAVMNMFTSFGYFKSDADHRLAMQHVAGELRSGGLFLLDFLNAAFVRKNLVESEVKTVEGVDFSLKRWIRAGYVYKSVEFRVEGQLFQFQEQVRLFELPDFKTLLNDAGLKLRRTYGDYDLPAFDPETSKRLILIAEKP